MVVNANYNGRVIDENDDYVPFFPTALLLCFQMWQCPSTKKISYLGIVDSMAAGPLPMKLKEITVAWRGIAEPGRYEMQLTVEHENEGSQRFFKLPELDITSVVGEKPVYGKVVINDMHITRAGTIWFRWHVNGRFMLQRSLKVSAIPAKDVTKENWR
jgi:hypothetical protein